MITLLRSMLICRRFGSVRSFGKFYGSSFLRSGKGHYVCDKVISLQLPFFTKRNISINIFETPNPNSIKFKISQNILHGDTPPQDFSSKESSKICDLASLLHQIPGVKSIYIGQDFVTISKYEENTWEDVKTKIDTILNEFFSLHNFVHMAARPEVANENKPVGVAPSNEVGNNCDDVVAMIREVIDSKIRPTIQEDGGDIVFMGFENGLVKVKLQGSCSDCPSSEVTLKRGVQNMLKFYVPEVAEVIQVWDHKDSLSEKEFEKFDNAVKKT